MAVLLALYVQLRGLLALLDPVAPELTQVGAGALIVFVAAVLGGVAGAWQAALAGVPGRREIVLVGAVCPGGGLRARQPDAVGHGVRRSGPGARWSSWSSRRARPPAPGCCRPSRCCSRACAATRGQTATEYMGALLLVALIIAALVTRGAARSATGVAGAIDAILGAGGRTEQAADRRRPRRPDRGRRRRRPHQRGGGRARHRPGRGGLRRRRHLRHRRVHAGHRSRCRASSRSPRTTSSSRGSGSGSPRTSGTTLEKSILDEINPGGWKGFLFGDAAEQPGPRRERRARARPARRDGRLRGREAEDPRDPGERDRRRPGQGPGQDPGRGRQGRERGVEERAGEAAGQPQDAPRGRGRAPRRRRRGRRDEGAAALPARPLAPPLREARRRVRLPDAGRVPQGRP